MSRYLLDTNACIAWLRNDEPITQHVVLAGKGHIWLCAPVKAELWFGACKSQRVAENQARLQRFFANLPSLPFDDDAAEHFGDIRATLAHQGKPIGPYDLQIAAIARAHGLIVVTHNTREFARVPGLMLEDWQLERPIGEKN
ncbi:MAG: type II toxin-antitoxin system VapC family toxin [Candidatus Competibacteraceae bacterium]|uniref:Ribonuclease VapC n=1 Tax=Candidatus Contendobacter odensis Run_B_J11 TaxID=1400861 RepID=A0A7U7J1Y0_9GAMM|nr:type II toxin-antitoxin system VapC family toxin [Candidatus Contendobacter odensis]MBK8533890.1 type II toxin-antitoxin system VapC family toxin [Candidatus Competibacteraceae bacterium]CDH44248.1 PilT protein domain protein [Candidatus Contendobacter odensis Run_B_J11]